MGNAAKADVVEFAPLKSQKDGRHEVLFPIGLPDEGTFEYLDAFLKENPGYTELSSRALVDWGLGSGLWRKTGKSRKLNDDPGMEFGIRDLDGTTLPQMVQAITGVQKRNYVSMQVKKNLLVEERKEAIAKFDTRDYKRVAMVAMGEPPADFKAKVHDVMLESKKKKAAEAVVKRRKDAEWYKQQEEKTKAAEKKEADSSMDGKKENGDEEDAKAEEPKEMETEAKAEESLEDEIKKAEEAVELTEQEKSICFKKADVLDVEPKDLSRVFADFALPEESEGFDEIRYVWQKRPACEAYLKSWITERKLNQRVEDLRPGTWFKEHWGKWTELVEEWRKKHNDWNDPARKRQLEK